VYAEYVPISFSPPEPGDIVPLAKKWFREGGGYDEQKLNARGVVTYLRHVHTNYDSLVGIFGQRPGAGHIKEERVAYRLLRKRVEVEIKQWLRDVGFDPRLLRAAEGRGGTHWKGRAK
jgi:hypothetical protein